MPIQDSLRLTDIYPLHATSATLLHSEDKSSNLFHPISHTASLSFLEARFPTTRTYVRHPNPTIIWLFCVIVILNIITLDRQYRYDRELVSGEISCNQTYT